MQLCLTFSNAWVSCNLGGPICAQRTTCFMEEGVAHGPACGLCLEFGRYGVFYLSLLLSTYSGVTSSSLPLYRSMAASLMGRTPVFKSSRPVPLLPCHRPMQDICLCLNQRAEQCNLQGWGPILRPGSSLVRIQTLSPAGAPTILCKIALSHRDPLAQRASSLQAPRKTTDKDRHQRLPHCLQRPTLCAPRKAGRTLSSLCSLLATPPENTCQSLALRPCL